MRILALDTITPAGSVALVDDEGPIEEPLEVGRPLATQLPGALMALLSHAGRALRDIDLFAVATGPGSFTGIRIGIATMQGLAFAQGKPLVGVSGFDALADAAGRVGRAVEIHVWVDAWRNEVYAATYAPQPIGEPVVAAPQTLLQLIPRPDAAFIGDGAVKNHDLIRASAPRATIVQPTPLLAATIGRLAGKRAERGDTPPPHAIRPLYVRRPDAELARGR